MEEAAGRERWQKIDMENFEQKQTRRGKKENKGRDGWGPWELSTMTPKCWAKIGSLDEAIIISSF